MITPELEATLHQVFVEATRKRHSMITVEHLLLALIDNAMAAAVLKACAADVDVLRQELTQFIEENTPKAEAGQGEVETVETQPTLGFQRVIQRAILNVQASGKKEVSGANILAAIFSEKDSHAVFFLQKHDIFDWLDSHRQRLPLNYPLLLPLVLSSIFVHDCCH